MAMKAVAAGSWYSRDGGVSKYFDATGDGTFVAESLPRGAVVLRDLKEQGLVVKENMGASLIDLGDGVLGLEFHTKMNSLDADIIGLYGEALDELEGSNDWQALVVGNQDPQAFSAGANIFMVLGAAMQQDWKQIEELTDGLQKTLMRAKHSRKPVVTAPHGLTLGGGLEVAMHSAATRASREMYAGLVEVGVGLIPAGGGCKELVFRLLGSVPAGVKMETSAILQQIFQYVGMAKVSMSVSSAWPLAPMPDSAVAIPPLSPSTVAPPTEGGFFQRAAGFGPRLPRRRRRRDSAARRDGGRLPGAGREDAAGHRHARP